MSDYRITEQRGTQRWILCGGTPVGYTRQEGIGTVVRDGYAYQVGTPTGRLCVYDEEKLVGTADSPAHALLMFVRSWEETNDEG